MADVMWLDDLWALGLTGGVVGLSVAWPLLRVRQVAGGVTDGSHRMIGLLLLGGAIATALIAVTHSPLASASLAIPFEHLQKTGDLLFWSFFTLWIRRSIGRPIDRPASVAIVAAPLLAYAAIALRSGEPLPFRWLLPFGGAAAVYALVLCLRLGRGDQSFSSRLRLRMVLIASALCAAQTVRTFWPDALFLREIVPLTMTVGFISIAELAMRRVFAEPGQPYVRSTLEPATAQVILSAIERGMRDEHWYRDCDLSLAVLAARIGAAPHAVSQALNQLAGRSLSEYLATWRVDEAKRLLQDPSNERFTIDGLAHSAGFGSRSAFYKTFKAVEGMTPTEFRARTRK